MVHVTVNIVNIVFVMMTIMIMMALTKNPIRTKSHIWDFVRQYGTMFVIIIIVIIIDRKVKVLTV